jgi:glycosyltransferase involved in cell wall biosynthesis
MGGEVRNSSRAAVIQLGSRESYALPQMIASDYSVTLITDLYLSRAAAWCARYLGLAVRSRYADALRGVAVRHEDHFGIAYWRALRRASQNSGCDEVHLTFGRAFGNWAATQIAPDTSVVVSFNGTALEAFRRFKGKAYLTLDQADAARLCADRIARERALYPDWEGSELTSCSALDDRTAEEWDLADCIVVNSLFARDLLVRRGVALGKIQVIPVAFASAADPVCVRRADHVVRLAFVGRLSVAKGVHRLHHALGKLGGGKSVELSLIGSSTLRPAMLAQLAATHRVLGNVPRAVVQQWLPTFDGLVFPTLADGFGIVQVEACRAGVPVLSTDACADIVNNDAIGVRVKSGDTVGLAEGLGIFVERISHGDFDKDMLRRRARDYDIGSVRELWRGTLRQVHA